MSVSVVVQPPPDVEEPLCEAGLRYVTDAKPGITRRRVGKAFGYVSAAGDQIRDSATLTRIRSLAIPPAWRDVWICPLANGHLQATGRDQRGRKQYRYHPRWNEVRSQNKYDRVIEFGEALPLVRRTIARHLRLPGLPREKVLAAVVRIMDDTLIRIGCEEYARDNQSYGLATLRRRHVKLKPGEARFEFRGKSGQDHKVAINDPRLLQIIRRCHELPGHELFKYVTDDGVVQDVGSSDINDYIRTVSTREFTAKDFRTWGGTIYAARFLAGLGCGQGESERKRNIAEAVKAAASELRNRPATCRKHYIHPAILFHYEAGSLLDRLNINRAGEQRAQRGAALTRDERSVLAFLKWARRQARRSAAGEDSLSRSLKQARARRRLRNPAALKRVS